MTYVCHACRAEQDHNTIRCEQCGKPLVFIADGGCRADALHVYEVEEAFAKADELMRNDPTATAEERAAWEAKKAVKDKAVAAFMQRMEVDGNA
jgi:predicted amidophosphoribosyltransferase